MKKITTILTCLILCIASHSLGTDHLQADKSIICEDTQPDGENMVMGQHNPYKMRGYIFAEVPVDNIVGFVLDNHIKPHMKSVCEDSSKDSAISVMVDLPGICGNACLSAAPAFGLNDTKTETLIIECQRNCSRSWGEIRHYIRGYEKALNSK